MPKNPKVYMDFTIGSKAAGRVVFELYTDMTPKLQRISEACPPASTAREKSLRRSSTILGARSTE
jgi:hypothetical protein